MKPLGSEQNKKCEGETTEERKITQLSFYLKTVYVSVNTV